MTIGKHLNWDYSGSLPYIIGDRYYGQDLIRDFHFLRNESGQILKDLSVNFPVCITGGIVTQGSGANINVTLGYGYVKKAVTIPNTFAALPPSTMSADIEAVRVVWGALTNFNAGSAGCSAYTITDDGATPNYVKVAYAESDGNTRVRAKKAGTYSYEKVPFYNFTVNATAPVAGIELCLASFTSNAGVYTITQSPYLAHQLKHISDKKTKVVTASAYVVLDNDGYDRIECDTTSNAITITMPAVATNRGRRIEVALVKNDATFDKVIIKGAAGSIMSSDALAEIWLTKVGDFIIVQESVTSAVWEIVDERLTAQLRLSAYAGYGSTDTKIVRWTNVIENVGTSDSTVADKGCFQENHTSGYHVTAETGAANAAGLEITINRSGSYAFAFSGDLSLSGMSLNSAQLATAFASITAADQLDMTTGASGVSLTVTQHFKKNDIIRPHTDGAGLIAGRSFFTVTYLGD